MERESKVVVVSDNEEREAVEHLRDVRQPCMNITEPEPNSELTREAYMAAVITNCRQTWLHRMEYHLGYPLDLNLDYGALSHLQPFPINNFGDPFIEGNYCLNSKQFEVGVLDWFANLWEIDKDKYWGYITSGGTEGNCQGILTGREMLSDGILYASKESHYSILKTAWMYRMKCIKIETLVSGEIDCADLKDKLFTNRDKPAIINLNIGTTVKGAIDDLNLVTQTLEECGFSRDRFYIHCDAALFGLMLPFIEQAPKITFKKPIDSVCVSGHKLLGCPAPCGVLITRIKHINALSKNVEYIASRDATISCSRNGHAPIFLWYILNKKGSIGLHKDVEKCLHNARYLKNRLKDAGISTMLNDLSNIVVFERPPDEDFIRRWQLSCQGNIAHVVVMLNVSKEKLDNFLEELIKKHATWFKNGSAHQPPCVASDIGRENCLCPLHK